MPVPPHADLSSPEARRDLRVTALAALGPVAWFVALLVLYALTANGCGPHTAVAAWSVLVGALLANALSLWGLSRSARTQGAARGAEAQRVGFMLWNGLALAALSLVLLGGFATILLAGKLCE